MKTALIALAIALGLLVAPLGLNVANKAIGPKATREVVNQAAVEKVIPRAQDTLETPAPVNMQGVKKTVTLEDSTTIVLRGPVTNSSVAKVIKELRAASRRVSKETPLYLVLDTPGGDIQAGTDLIDFAKALPQKIHTVTLFAASMGFQIAQNLNNRYITTNGQLMSHRARVGGLGGQIKGEFESRYRMIRRTVDMLDYVASQRMGLDVKTYENMIFNEYWVYGFDAIGDKAADEQVLVQCGETLDGTDSVLFETMFGTVKVSFSKCPLIKEPEGIEMGGIAPENKAEVLKAIKMSLSDEKEFVNQFITTGRFNELFR
jgi:ATP-dependent protease ClpP protease subunit